MMTGWVSNSDFVRGDTILAVRKKSSHGDVDAEIRERQVGICKAFANATRLHMLDLLGQQEWPVSELQAKVGISKANLSQHLAVLKSAGIVQTRREGRTIHCSLAIPEVKSACQIIRDVLRSQIRNGQKLTV